MRYALLLLLLSGCTIVPIADAGPCSATTNARGCQENPYLVKRGTESTAQGDASQKVDAGR